MPSKQPQDAAKREPNDELRKLMKELVAEARIDEVKLVAQLFVGLPTKTMKRADLKYYLINRIAELKEGER